MLMLAMQFITDVHRVRKKSLHFFLNNFNKCKFAFIIFGTRYHNYTLY